MPSLPPKERTSEPGALASLADYEPAAVQRLDATALAYLLGGAADEVSVWRNRKAFERLQLLPRVLRRSCAPWLSVSERRKVVDPAPDITNYASGRRRRGPAQVR